jgi:hypothetical protein
MDFTARYFMVCNVTTVQFFNALLANMSLTTISLFLLSHLFMALTDEQCLNMPLQDTK